MNQPNQVDLAAFERLLDVHGPDLGRWPDAEQAFGKRCLEASAAARQRRAEAERLAQLLQRAAPAPLPPGLRARILAVPEAQARRALSWWPFPAPFGPGLSWGLATVLGLLVGSLQASEPGPAHAELGPSQEEDWVELGELALGANFALEEGGE